MDEDTPAKIEKMGWGFIKWVIRILTTLGILGIFGTFFWAVFYSDYFANISFIIPVRVAYQYVFWKAEKMVLKPTHIYPPFDPIYTIQVTKYDGNLFTYTFFGTFSNFDFRGNNAVLKGFDGNIYTFEIPISLFDAHDVNALGLVKDPTHLGVIEIDWTDGRPLSEIKSDSVNYKSMTLNDVSDYFNITTDLTRVAVPH